MLLNVVYGNIFLYLFFITEKLEYWLSPKTGKEDPFVIIGMYYIS